MYIRVDDFFLECPRMADSAQRKPHHTSGGVSTERISIDSRQPETVQYWRHCDQRHERSSAAADQLPKTSLTKKRPRRTRLRD